MRSLLIPMCIDSKLLVTPGTRFSVLILSREEYYEEIFEIFLICKLKRKDYKTIKCACNSSLTMLWEHS